MVKAAKTGSAKKFGTRYGRTNREKYGRIDAMQKAKYPCPYCKYVKVNRLNTGIWQCDKCGAKFASKAYYVPKQSTRVKEQTETVQE